MNAAERELMKYEIYLLQTYVFEKEDQKLGEVKK